MRIEPDNIYEESSIEPGTQQELSKYWFPFFFTVGDSGTSKIQALTSMVLQSN